MSERFSRNPFPDRVRVYWVTSLSSSFQKQLIVLLQALVRLACKAPPTRLQKSALLSLKK